MKLIQMQYSPDAFDSVIKQKLDDVDIDQSAEKQYFEQMSKNILYKRAMVSIKKL